VLRDASNNITANAYFNGFNSITASGTAITLTVASAPVQYVSGSGGQTIKLPDATTLLNGTIFSFNNNQSSGAITVNNNSNTLVVSVPSGAYVTVVLLSNATAAGSWDRHDQTPSNTSWSTNTLDYPGSITSATWNGATVQVNRGGTGLATIPAGNVVIGNGTSALYGLAPGTAGNVLTSIGGAWVSNAAVGGGGSPGGSTTQFQYNNGGAFAGAANLTTDGANVTVGSANTLRFANLTSATYVGFKANAIVAANVTWTLPVADGTAGQFLSTNGSGVLSWSAATPASPSSVEYLVVAGGGGGGGDIGGGGGSGGFQTNTLSVTTGVSYTVTVGGGGAGATGSNNGTVGSNSVFSSVTATGGGGGGKSLTGTAGSGGSGGGGGWNNSGSTLGGGAGTSGQGFAGGNGGSGSGISSGTGGGGGGSSAVGAVGKPGSTGNGGAGTASSITGSSVTYGGGGGGGAYNTTGATGGSSIGGSGGAVNDPGTVTATPTAGSTNTGSGGGGGGAYSQNGAAGGSGIVSIRYSDSFAAASATTGSPTITVAGGYRIYTWTGSGSITF
jgi:hypothetical protein